MSTTPSHYPASFTRLHLQDQCQDLLWIDIDRDLVLGAGPFHNDKYALMIFYNYYEGKPPRKGGSVKVSVGPDHPIMTIRWPIVKVEHIKVVEK